MLTKCDRIKAQKTPEKALSEVCFPKAKFINSVKSTMEILDTIIPTTVF